MIKYMLIFILFFSQPINVDVTSLFNKVVEKNKEYSNVSFTFIISQKIGSTTYKSKAFVKYRRKPLSIYYKQFYPKKDVEILYNKSLSSSKVLVNPNGFPWTNLTLSYNSAELRENQHHSVINANFDYIINIISKTFKNLDSNKKTSIESAVYRNTNCYKITYENTNYKFIKYTTKSNETVSSIANKFNINDYKILEINKLESYGKVPKNKILILPNDYSKKAIFYINKSTLLPLKIIIYDENGIFEELEYFDIKTNVNFKNNEFSQNFSEYHF